MKREYSDEDISHELLIYNLSRNGQSIPAYPKTTELENSRYFPTRSIQTILNKKIWTFIKNPTEDPTEKLKYILSCRLPFKVDTEGILRKNESPKGSDSYFERTEENGEIWDYLKKEIEKKIQELSGEVSGEN